VTRYQVLYWQKIPSLVRVFAEDGSATSHQLPDWFQQEIDRLAMEQGLTGSDAYLEQWHWGDAQERPEPASELVEALTAEFQQQFRQTGG
jgi:cvfA/B/C family virulence factor